MKLSHYFSHSIKYIIRCAGLICLLLFLCSCSSQTANQRCVRGDCENGFGGLAWPDGTLYVGEWKESLMNGQGTIIYANGTKYVGAWNNGNIHGLGTITFPSGHVQSGLWNNQTFVGKQKVPTYSCRGRKCFTVADIQKESLLTNGPTKQDTSIKTLPDPQASKKPLDTSLNIKPVLIKPDLNHPNPKKQNSDVDKNVSNSVHKNNINSGQKDSSLTKRKYYALIIGNSDYANLPKLKNATEKAKEISAVLVKHFGFKVNLLLNAKKVNIRKTLDRLKEKLDSNDSLLIYYIGHKEYNNSDKKIYWLPTDAENEYPMFTDSQWINGDEIKIRLADISAKHILVIGSLFSSIWKRKSITKLPPEDLRNQSLIKLNQRKSRTIITNKRLGDVSETSDKIHSQFADAFLAGLQAIKPDIFSAKELYIKHLHSEKLSPDQPLFEYGVFEKPSRPTGVFIFNRIRK